MADKDDFTELVLPGFGAYAGSRLLSRMTYQIAEKRGMAAPHLAAGMGLAAAGALWYFGERLESVAKYRDALLIGAGIGALQSATQTYVPKYGWVTGDYLSSPEAKKAAQEAAQSAPDIDEVLANDDELEKVPLQLPEPKGQATEFGFGGGDLAAPEDALQAILDGE